MLGWGLAGWWEVRTTAGREGEKPGWAPGLPGGVAPSAFASASAEASSSSCGPGGGLAAWEVPLAGEDGTASAPSRRLFVAAAAGAAGCASILVLAASVEREPAAADLGGAGRQPGTCSACLQFYSLELFEHKEPSFH